MTSLFARRRTEYWRLIAAVMVALSTLHTAVCGQTVVRPMLRSTALETAALLSWDSLAENAQGQRFQGYRLYRGRLEEGPFSRVREWRKESGATIQRSYLDVGDDDGDGIIERGEGLRNEVSYLYWLAAFADSSVSPVLPAVEISSETLLVIPRAAPTNFSANTFTLTGQTGIQGSVQTPEFVVTNAGNFRALYEGHAMRVEVNTQSTGTEYLIPVIVRDLTGGAVSTYVFTPGCQIAGDSANPGPRQGEFHAGNVFGSATFDVRIPYAFEQLSGPLRLDTAFVATNASGANTPVFFSDTTSNPFVGLKGTSNMLGEATYDVEFLTGGIDTVNAAAKQIFRYLTVRITAEDGARTLQPDTITSVNSLLRFNRWALTRYAYNLLGNPNTSVVKLSANRYYIPSFVDSSASWEFTNILGVEDSRIVMDYADKGRALGRPWPRAGYKATVDFAPGDRIRIVVPGGARGPFPSNATFTYQVEKAGTVQADEDILSQIRVVPNPYVVQHEAQASTTSPSLRFDYLPDECTIRIYTIGLDLVRTLEHRGGAVEFWDLRNETGTTVGSQLFVAHIEAPGGSSTLVKFAVVVGARP